VHIDDADGETFTSNCSWARSASATMSPVAMIVAAEPSVNSTALPIVKT